jgi:hypothetical protein
MRHITVSVDDETYIRARVAAAERGTSVPALVKAYLEQLASHETDIERLKRQEREIRSQIVAFSASERLSRHDVQLRSVVLRRPASQGRTGWAEAARRIADAGDDELVMGEFGNAEDPGLVW